MDAALDCIIHEARTQQDACARYMAQHPELTRSQAVAALYAAIERSAWALLVAPELWALACEWWTIARIEGYIERLNARADTIAAAIDQPETLLLVEMEGASERIDGEGNVYRTIKTGPDVLSVRVKALSDVSGTLGKLEAELARARARYVRCVELYQDSLIAIADMPPVEQARALLRQQWTEQHKAGMRAQLSLAEQPRALIGCDPALLMGELEALQSAKRQALARRDHAAVGVLGAEIRELTRATTGPAAMPDEAQDEAELARLEAERAAGRI